MIETRSLIKSVHTTEGLLTILKGIDLRITEGEVVAIVGASGSGKSTLLGLMAGLDGASSGDVLLGGQNFSAMDEEQRAMLRGQLVGFVFQSFQLLPSLTALENAMLPIELKGDSLAREKAQQLLSRVGLQERCHHYPNQLSGGEQQRVAIARAFATEAKILFADEPTGNLDTATGERVIELLFDLNREFSTTLVLVTHDERLAQRCDRIIKLVAGEIASDSIPAGRRGSLPDNRSSDPMPVGSLNPNLIKVALRLLWRDWQGGELRLLFIALVMAVTSVTGIALFTDRLERALLLESANMLAADRIVSGRGELPEAVLAEGQSRGLRTAQTLSFTSMAFSDSGNLLVAAKAVTDSYPLRGEVIITEEAFTRGRPIVSGPPPGEVWLEARALPALNIEVGDSVFVGEAELTVSQIIITEPDRTGGSMIDNAGPRLMLKWRMLRDHAVQLVLVIRYLFASDELSDLDEFESWFRAQEEWRGRFYIRDVRDESQEVADALDRAESFLLLGSLFAVVLAGVAIALTAKRYSERHFDYVAILKTLGCTSSQISFIYLLVQLVLALFAVIAGWALGWLVHQGILQVLESVMQVALPEPGLEPYVIGALTALICLLAFALPPLIALRETPPLRVLRKDMSQQKISDKLPYAFGLLGTVFLVYWYSQDLVLTSVLVSSVAGIALFLSVFLCLSAIRWFCRHESR